MYSARTLFPQLVRTIEAVWVKDVVSIEPWADLGFFSSREVLNCPKNRRFRAVNSDENLDVVFQNFVTRICTLCFCAVLLITITIIRVHTSYFNFITYNKFEELCCNVEDSLSQARGT